MKIFAIIFTLALLSCKAKAPKAPDLVDPTPSINEQYRAAVERLDGMLDDGWVVARDEDNRAFDQGDSLIFSGIAAAALPCDHATPLTEAFPDGQLYRHPSLTRSISLDGALGYYFAAAAQIVRCHSEAAWGPSVTRHYAYSESHGDALNDNADATVSKEFTYIRDLLAYRVGARGEPSGDRKVILEAQIAAWAQAVMVRRAACYRIHLGWLALRTMEMLDKPISNAGKLAFCEASNGSDLPVVDNWCGRGNLIEWIDQFKFDVWGYRHQRCPEWESPDGNDRKQPGVDFLLAIRESYNI